MKFLKIITVALSSCAALPLHAQDWSYVYIQGDKQTPFYVKLEGEMLPRYSKNYYIIPELGPGPVNLQILYQQNEYPPQTYQILVPKNSHRGFMLAKNNNAYALYDIQQKFFLTPGGMDHLPENLVATATSAAEQGTQVAGNDPGFLNDVVLDNEHTAPTATEASVNIATEPAVEEQATPSAEEPEMPAIETAASIETTNETESEPQNEEPLAETTLENEPTPQNQMEQPIEAESPQEAATYEEETPASTIPEPVNTVSVPTPKVTAPPAQIDFGSSTPAQKAHINENCPEPTDAVAFDKMYQSVRGKEDDDSKIDYLLKLSKSNCFTTRQVYFLTKELGPESMRYSFLKKVYGHVTDQDNFKKLEDYLFTTLEWKSYFRLIYK